MIVNEELCDASEGKDFMEKKVCVNNLKLSIFASGCERFCMSNRAAPALSYALLVNIGLFTQ